MTVYEYLNIRWKVSYRLLKEWDIDAKKRYDKLTLEELEFIAGEFEVTVSELV